jgi:zinc/manganese transport system substrate-binding protein
MAPLLALATTVALAGCGLSTAPGTGASSTVEVVAADNFWGSIAGQVGGSRVHVTSLVVNPDTDPHVYEPKPEDARRIAQARYVIANGAGYDPWVVKLMNANPVVGRRALLVGALLGRKEGDNPHFWYSPEYVDRVVDRITEDLKKIDPADVEYFDRQNVAYKTQGLKAYRDTIEVIRQKYAGAPVGATESIFVYLAASLGLQLVTPPEYMKAISEGADPSAADKATVDRQIVQGRIRVLVFNAQNTTPDVNAYVDKARAHGIPVIAVTEMLTPTKASFQDWQTGQLRNVLDALGG